jgi:hypothetical protein
MSSRPRTAEAERILANRATVPPWRAWGPYVSDRQWGTVREDYSPDGAAWDYFPFAVAHRRAYRWGEDGLAGWCDLEQRLVLSLALWNGNDEILKERLFGLANAQGNHGEDVKEIYFYLDGVPSHAWHQMLYKYPQAAFPYERLREENAKRTRKDPEFELIDTGIFDDSRYFDVFVEYAKPDPNSVVMRIVAHNRGDADAPLDLVPQLTFRNTWSWSPGAARPSFAMRADGRIDVRHPDMPAMACTAFGEHRALFCENETNVEALWSEPRAGRVFKDGLHDAIVGRKTGVTRDDGGTKVGLWRSTVVPAKSYREMIVHLGRADAILTEAQCREALETRRREADEAWDVAQATVTDPDRRRVQRQAFAGLLWSKQFYNFDVRRWLDGDPSYVPPPPERKNGRDQHWRHFSARTVLAMPDKWEYPWFAAWDHAFHAVAFARLDSEFAKSQISDFLTDSFVHPNGALPAYEWAFDDANPPLQAWAAWRVYQIDRKARGIGDLDFLIHVLNRLSMNFTWWVNRKDADGRNVFEGGFLGLDNIGVFDRSRPMPGGGVLQQADGTAWMGMFALQLMRISIELAVHWPVYQDLAIKFFLHFLQIASAMTAMGGGDDGLWDEEAGFYFDMLRLPGGELVPLKILSVVGLVPLFCVETIEPETLEKLPIFRDRVERTLNERPDLANLVSRWSEPGRGDRRMLSLLRGHRMKAILRKVFDPAHFLSDYGVRGLSKSLKDNPYEVSIAGEKFCVSYEPGEGQSALFGGNSNWRGPIWMPINYLLVESLQKFHHYYGDDFKIEAPVGSGRLVTLHDAADELSSRLVKLFVRGHDGRRPVLGANAKLQDDQYFRDHVPFFEYFHGDTGEGLGARAQTGWSALVAKLIFPHGVIASPNAATATQ